MTNSSVECFVLKNRRGIINNFHTIYGHDRMQMERLWELLAGYFPLTSIPIMMKGLFDTIKNDNLDLSLDRIRETLDEMYGSRREIQA